MRKRKELTGKFTAFDSSGNAYLLLVYTNFIGAGTLGDPHAEVAGLKEIQTSEGQHVNRIERGKYQIVVSGIDLTSTDPAAI